MIFCKTASHPLQKRGSYRRTLTEETSGKLTEGAGNLL
jgi:hypothetical protein